MGGTSVAVGGTGVLVGGMGVAVGGTGVEVSGTGVAEGGRGVSVGGRGVLVGRTTVGVAVGRGPAQAMTKSSGIRSRAVVTIPRATGGEPQAQLPSTNAFASTSIWREVLPRRRPGPGGRPPTIVVLTDLSCAPSSVGLFLPCPEESFTCTPPF